MAAAVPAILEHADPNETDGDERFYRVCVLHRERLTDNLQCPQGHRVRWWGTYDSLRNVVYGGGNADRSVVAEGELDDALAFARDILERRPVNRHLGVVNRNIGPTKAKAFRELQARQRGAIQPVALHLPIEGRG